MRESGRSAGEDTARNLRLRLCLTTRITNVLHGGGGGDKERSWCAVSLRPMVSTLVARMDVVLIDGLDLDSTLKR
jgi:hypothetical protein